MLALTVSAQTDVTDTYLTDTDFSSTDGWTEYVSDSFRDYGNGLIGTYNVRFSAATVDDTHLATEYCLGFECRWATTYASYNQTAASLPEGRYTLSFDVQNVNGNTTSASYNNLFYVKVDDVTYTDESTEWMTGSSSWTTHTITFDVIGSANSFTVSLGYGTGSNNFHANNTPALYVSHLSLMRRNLLTAHAEAYNDACVAAGLALGNKDYDNVVGTERTTLSELLEEDEPSTVAVYAELTSNIENATAAFIAAKANYDALVTEIAKAKALGVDETDADNLAATSASTAASALANTQALKMMEYNLVTNTYAYEVELGKWTASSGTGSQTGQHWSGDNSRSYMEQSGANWSASAWSISYDQDVTLPAGNYVFKVAGRTANGDGVTMSLVVKNKADESTLGTVSDFPKGDIGYGIDTSGATNFSSEGTYANNNAGRGWEWRYVKFTLNEQTTVNIAVAAVATTNHMWVSFCDATVRTDNEANISMIAYNIALNDAQNALNNDSYANVSGDEKTALEAAIAADPGTTATSVDAATEALQTATAAFTAAKANYDAFVTAYDTYTSLFKELAYATAAKKTAYEETLVSPTTSAEAGERAAAIPAALRAYFESHAMAENVDGATDYTERISNFTDPTSNDGWTITGNMNNPASNQPWTDADGTATHAYFDGGNWGGSAWTTTMTQTVVVPAGKYLLTVKARAAENVTFTLSVGENSADLPHTGSSGNVFNNGWTDASLEFETDGNDIDILVTATTESQYQWFSISDFRLIRLEAIEVALADDDDYAALAATIAAAEAKTLGFQEDEFAPYVNVEALTLLAEAKAIDPEFEDGNLQAKVQTATSALTNATWTANTEDVDAIYNGLFATVTEGANYPLAWTRTNGWGQMRTEIEGDFATAYYNQPGSLQYGNQGVYTMPLAAETYYTLTLSYRSHEWGSNTGVTVSVLNGEDGLSGKTLAGNASTTDWATKSVTFKTGAAGDYVLTLANSGNTWMTNVSLVKAVPETVTMSITSDTVCR